MRVGIREIVRVGPSIPKAVSTRIVDRVLAREGLHVFSPNRRAETRIAEQKVCEYEICVSINETGAVIEQGEAYSLNRSAHGILLLTGCFPQVGQILELRISESRWSRSVSLYNVQWVKPLSVDCCGRLCLVGCRLVFGPSRYWAV
ncbi:MAG: hypothetical protein NNA22_03690 [Nitrospira sp.]|nr:hypothetical protein [Nitrospira sp.]MCP9456056.1 hypothetical protein [Nitrospira sp.]